MQSDERLIVALDFPTADLAKACVEELGDSVCHYKVGMELYYAAGSEIIRFLKEHNKKVFLDLKLHDIPNTVASALAVLTELGADMMNVHAIGGRKMMQEAIKAVHAKAAELGRPAPKLIAVTILTSINEEQYADLNYKTGIAEQVIALAKLAKEAGMDEQIPDMVNLLCNDFGFNHVTEFMRLTPPHWLAEVLGEASPLHASLSSMGHKYTGYFRYENADETVTRFRHIATDRIIEATNRSLIGIPRDMKDPSLILRTGFIQWNGEWWLSGQISSYEDSEDLIGQITGDDDEYNLFEPEEELPEEEQRIILTDILATTEGEDGQTLDASDTAWQALLNDEIGKDFFISQVKAGEITGLQFYNAPGRLLLDNIDFVTEYVKR